MLNTVDYIFLYAIVSIWVLLLMNIVLVFGGYKFYLDSKKENNLLIKEPAILPKVTILVPAHNEGIVIEKTARALLSLYYPKDKLEIIIINDNSSDDTGLVLENVKKQYPDRDFKIISTDETTGGKGKSNALNIGLKASTGDYVAVYDADNTPEKMALIYLISTIVKDDSLGAVIGKFRTRNKRKNILTKFINIETLSFQWMAQAGRWKLFRLCTIPGTNFVVRKEILDKLEGWDISAIAEDTEISFRIYQMGYRIKLVPQAVTWEQEPETLRVWSKQRTRWATGNIYVLSKYFIGIFKNKTPAVLFDLIYFFSVYVLFLSSVIASDVIFLLGIFTPIRIQLTGNYMIIWTLSYILFILEVYIALTLEKGESKAENLILVAIMYFTYCQLWLFIAIGGLFRFIKDTVTGKGPVWYKTERFK